MSLKADVPRCQASRPWAPWRTRLFTLSLSVVGLVAPWALAEGDVVIDDQNPKASLPSPAERAQEPMVYGSILMELTERAEGALTAGEYARAARYFDAIVSAVPEQAVGYRKLCEAKAKAGDLPGARAVCREALSREGATTRDHVRFLATLLAEPDSPSAGEIAEIDRSIAHLSAQKAVEPDFERLTCELALRLNDLPRLETCIASLEKSSTDDPRTAAYAWALAMHRMDEPAARVTLQRARTLGHDAAKLAEMDRAMEQTFSHNGLVYTLGGLLLAGGLVALYGLRPRRHRPAYPMKEAAPLL